MPRFSRRLFRPPLPKCNQIDVPAIRAYLLEHLKIIHVNFITFLGFTFLLFWLDSLAVRSAET